MAYATTFTFTCPWGCTVDVTDGQEQPHVCDGTSAILDAMRVTPAADLTALEYAERLAARLAPVIRERRAESWETGVHDGRSGEKFYGIDP